MSIKVLIIKPDLICSNPKNIIPLPIGQEKSIPINWIRSIHPEEVKDLRNMHFIKNFRDLAKTPERKIVLELVEAAFSSIQPEKVFEQNIHRHGNSAV